MIRIFIIIIWIPFTSVCQQQELKNEIEKIIWHDTSIDFEETPGFITAIILPDTHYILSFGSTSLQDTQQLKSSDIFELGGLTKVFTAELVSQLEQKNILRGDATVHQLLPTSFTNSKLNHLSLFDLVNHRSSFPKVLPVMAAVELEADQPYQNFTKAQVLEYVQLPHPKTNQPDRFLYAPYNYALIECLLEHHLNESFDTLLNKYLLGPLDMDATHVHSDQSTICSLTNGYNLAFIKSNPLIFASFQASEGMHSSLDDLVKFCRYRINLTHPKAYHRKIGVYKGAGISRKLYFEDGWYIIKSKRAKFIYSHAGKSNGHSAYLHYVPETKTGVVLLANSAKGTEDLSLLILRLINNYRI